MRKTSVGLAVLVALAATLGVVAAARPASGTQRVSITHNGDSFVLTPTSSGAIRTDRGTVTFCCWTSRHVVRAGKTLVVDDPRMTLVGAHGTLRLRNRIAWVDVPGGWSVFTGTWKVVGGTGAYAGLTGHGQAAGVKTTGGSDRAQFFGFLAPK
ncbi:MAG TPA: hypothetical protein VMK12_32120 [Anaeromyxobacteraceae bacterium]|nr:hypothetical protein [Anaeromyxobacteraceae bacterium]